MAKEVELTEGQEIKKPTYEELENGFKELANKFNELGKKFKQAQVYIASINRLDYLLKVMETSKEYSEEFITMIKSEIEAALTPKPEEENKEEEETK